MKTCHICRWFIGDKDMALWHGGSKLRHNTTEGNSQPSHFDFLAQPHSCMSRDHSWPAVQGHNLSERERGRISFLHNFQEFRSCYGEIETLKREEILFPLLTQVKIDGSKRTSLYWWACNEPVTVRYGLRTRYNGLVVTGPLRVRYGAVRARQLLPV